MQIGAKYSHLNGLEYLQVHLPHIWQDVEEVITGIDAEQCRTKESEERTMKGRLLYAPKDMNNAFKQAFSTRGWSELRQTFWTTDDPKLIRQIYGRPESEQKQAIADAGQTPIMTYNQTDFVKERVAVEVQFGKYSFVAHDLFVKHVGMYVANAIDVGIEILPMKELEAEMSSGVPYYQRDLFNVVRQGRGVPSVPLVLVGVKP